MDKKILHVFEHAPSDEHPKLVETLDWSHMTKEEAREALRSETERNGRIGWSKGVRRWSQLHG